LHIALTFVFWTCTLKKRPFLWFCSWFYTIRSLYYSEFCISLRISRFLEEQTFTLRRKPRINLRLRPRTYNLHTTSTLRNITSNPSQKPCNFIYIYKYDPFTPNNYFILQFDCFDYLDKSYYLAPCDFTEYYSITLSLAILAYPVL
jgi:hypothetical protein